MQKQILKKDFFKQMNNSVYGKAMETINQSIKKRINLRLVSNMKDYLKYMRKPIFISQ